MRRVEVARVEQREDLVAGGRVPHVDPRSWSTVGRTPGPPTASIVSSWSSKSCFASVTLSLYELSFVISAIAR